MRTTTLAAAGILTTVVGCGVGGIQGSGGGNELACAAPVSITGSFSMEAAQPNEISGCWPIGTWSFSITVGDGDCGDVPAPLATYAVRFERDLSANQPDYEWISTYLTDPSDTSAHVSVTSGGGGLCEGNIQIYSADGRAVWNLHPALQADGSITGQGEFMRYTSDQRPQPDA